MQAMNHQYHLERAVEAGEQVVRLVLITADYDRPPYFPGFVSKTHKTVVAKTLWNQSDIVLQIEMENEKFTVRYGKMCIRDRCSAGKKYFW